jgi:histidinol-phosphate aminotransferase
MSLFKSHLDAMVPYVPGEQPGVGDKFIKLNSNENPYPPSLQALRAIGRFDGTVLQRYSDPMSGLFRQAVSQALNVPPEWILPGNGSDDLIVMICRACLSHGRALIYPVPTFTFYKTQGLIEGAEIIEVPLKEDFTLPMEALIEAKGAVTFVANPNSPTGVAATTDELETLARRISGLLVIDEAYVDFAEENALRLALKYENVMVLRTLSKGYSLAGLRLGFGICSPHIMKGLLKTKSIYNLGALQALLGAAAMGDQAYKDACAARIKASRAKLSRELARLGFEVTPSQANFIFVRAPGGRAREVHDALKARRILVRFYDEPRLRDKLRITVGTEEENEALVTALEEVVRSLS